LRESSFQDRNRINQMPAKRTETTSDTPRSAGRRLEWRQNCEIAAKLTSHGSYLSNCVINDVSRNGMRIRVPPSTVLPSELEVNCAEFFAPQRVKIVWRRGEILGVYFLL